MMSAPEAILMLARARLTGNWHIYRIQIELADPHGIVSVQINSVDPAKAEAMIKAEG